MEKEQHIGSNFLFQPIALTMPIVSFKSVLTTISFWRTPTFSSQNNLDSPGSLLHSNRVGLGLAALLQSLVGWVTRGLSHICELRSSTGPSSLLFPVEWGHTDTITIFTTQMMLQVNCGLRLRSEISTLSPSRIRGFTRSRLRIRCTQR